MWQVYRQNPTTVYWIHYHFVWVTRRHRKVLRGALALRLQELIYESCQGLEIEIQGLEIQPNVVELQVHCPPILAPHQVVHRIKAHSAHHLRREFEQLQSLPSMWTRAYFVSTAETVAEETIKDYVQSQKKKKS